VINFHSPDVDPLTYLFCKPVYWGSIIIVVISGVLMRAVTAYWKETNTKSLITVIVTWFLLFVFTVSGLFVIYYKVMYLTSFWG
jgi:hypothetical protein